MLYAIAAVDENNAIGFENKLLYNLPQDMLRFKKLTLNKTVIMGKNTYFSLKIRPLPNRRNIVLAHSKIGIDATVCNSLKELAEIVEKESSDVFVIGGESVYKALLPFCKKAYITRVFAQAYEYDAVFPQLDDNWILTEKSEIMTSDEGIEFCYLTYDNTAPVSLSEME